MKRFAVLTSGGDAPGVRHVEVNWPAGMAQLTREPDIVTTEHLQYALARVDCGCCGSRRRRVVRCTARIAGTPSCPCTSQMAGLEMGQTPLDCHGGGMSAIAACTLVKLGYTNVWNLDGGMSAWK